MFRGFVKNEEEMIHLIEILKFGKLSKPVSRFLAHRLKKKAENFILIYNDLFTKKTIEDKDHKREIPLDAEEILYREAKDLHEVASHPALKN